MLPLEFLDEISCFETLRAYGGKIFHLDAHLGRLTESCGGIGRSFPVSKAEIEKWLKDSLKESGFPGAILRLSVHPAPDGEGLFVLIIRQFEFHPRELYEKGVKLRTTVTRRWALKAQDPQIKASQFVSGVMAFLDKGDREARELVFLDQGGAVAEGTVSNLFIFKQKRLLTPSVSSGILRGVTRSVVLDLARERRIEVLETVLTRHEIYSADECFMTNTSSEILPVVSVDDRKIGNGLPGPLTKALAGDFKKAVAKDLDQRRL